MIQFNLGFRVPHKINLYFRRIFENMGKKGEVDIKSRYPSLKKYDITGDFHFVLIETTLTHDYDLKFKDHALMNLYGFLEKFSRTPEKMFELDESITTTEQVPMIIAGVREWDLKRIDLKGSGDDEKTKRNQQLQENISKKGEEENNAKA